MNSITKSTIDHINRNIIRFSKCSLFVLVIGIASITTSSCNSGSQDMTDEEVAAFLSDNDNSTHIEVASSTQSNSRN